MKSVLVTDRVEIAGMTLFPGPAIVSDELADVLVDLSALDDDPLDYRSANALDKLVFRGAYDADTAYVKGDVVTEGGSSFVALTGSTGEDTDDTDFFAPLELETGLNIPVTNLAALGTTSNLTALAVTNTVIGASNVALSTSNTYTDAAVKAAIDGAVDTLKTAVVTALNLKADNADAETLRTQVEARLDALDAKVDAMIAKIVSAGIMAAP